MAYCTPTSDDGACEDNSRTVAIELHAIPEFMETTDNIFRVFTSLDMSTIRALPAMYLIRIIYTFIVLVKLYFAATKLPTQDARLQVARLQVSQRLDRVIQMSAGWGPLWPATKLTAVFSRMRSWFESVEDCNRQGMLQAESWLTLWEFKTLSVNEDTHGIDMLAAASDVDILPFSLGPDFSTAYPCFRSMGLDTEASFPKDTLDIMQDDEVPLDAGQSVGDIPDMEQTDDTPFDWSQIPDMGFDLCNLDVHFNSNAVTKEDFLGRLK